VYRVKNRREIIMANLVIVCGPQAVGKMTVAESLRDKLRYNMMMNHDSIDIWFWNTGTKRIQCYF